MDGNDFMNKKKMWIIITAAAVALAALIGVLCWLYWPGCRVVGDTLYVDIQETGFAFDPETGELLGQTPVTVSGTAGLKAGKLFSGEILVEGYQNSSSGTITGSGAAEKQDDGSVLIYYNESCVHYETAETEADQTAAAATEKVEHICDYYYTVCLYPRKGDLTVVEVGSYLNETLVYVICAENEAEARELYQWYVENR